MPAPHPPHTHTLKSLRRVSGTCHPPSFLSFPISFRLRFHEEWLVAVTLLCWGPGRLGCKFCSFGKKRRAGGEAARTKGAWLRGAGLSPAGARRVRSLWLQSRTPLWRPQPALSPPSLISSPYPPHPKTVSDSKFLSGSCKGIRLLPGGARLSPSFQGDAFVPTDSNPPSGFTKDPCERSPLRKATAPSPSRSAHGALASGPYPQARRAGRRPRGVGARDRRGGGARRI